MDHHDIKNMKVIRELDLIKLGDTVVDVGANVGAYTSFMLQQLGATGKVYSIELYPHTFSNLEMRFGHHKNIEVLNAAISDTNGTESYYAGENSEVHNILGHDTSYQANVKIGEIKSITLDELLKDEEEVSLIKIDVEGAELKVLNGMKNVAKRTRAVLIENHLDEDWPKIRTILIEDFGFSCYNVEQEEDVDINSPRPYQCLCQRNAT